MYKRSRLGELFLVMGKRIPIKTRIAVWFIFLITLLWSAFELVTEALGGFRGGDMGLGWLIVFALFYICPYVMPACLLLLRSKLAYISAISILILYLAFANYSVGRAFTFHYSYIMWSIIVLIPLTLIVLDMKNYWSVARS
jgi:hypothetical protein